MHTETRNLFYLFYDIEVFWKNSFIIAAVGPSASKNGEYKNPEYFCYNVTSFAEAEVEMAKFRLPAPSNKKKYMK